MKRITCVFFIFLASNVYAQTDDQAVNWVNQVLKNGDLSTEECKSTLIKYDFGSLWTNPDNDLVYGFIGNNYQRIRVKIISVIKAKNNADTYIIIGKSMVKDNICHFTGTIKITKARICKNMHWGVDNISKNKGIKKQGIIIAKYLFLEDSTQAHSGTFEGFLSTSWYIDKDGILKYDNIERFSDSYSNNQFIGIWKRYKSNQSEICNWGDYRIPLSGDLDIGAGEFSPDGKYLQYGWQTYRVHNKPAQKEKEKPWWE